MVSLLLKRFCESWTKFRHPILVKSPKSHKCSKSGLDFWGGPFSRAWEDLPDFPDLWCLKSTGTHTQITSYPHPLPNKSPSLLHACLQVVIISYACMRECAQIAQLIRQASNTTLSPSPTPIIDSFRLSGPIHPSPSSIHRHSSSSSPPPQIRLGLSLSEEKKNDKDKVKKKKNWMRRVAE